MDSSNQNRDKQEEDDEPDDWYTLQSPSYRYTSIAVLMRLSHRRDKRIFSTGCAGETALLSTRILHKQVFFDSNLDEQTNMNDCYFDKKDWRACSKEASRLHCPSLDTLGRLWCHHSPSPRNCINLLISKDDLNRWKPFANVGRGKETTRGLVRRMLKRCRFYGCTLVGCF